LNIQSPTGEKLAVFNQNNDVELYYDASQKLATTSTGVDVTGGLTVSENASSPIGITIDNPSGSTNGDAILQFTTPSVTTTIGIDATGTDIFKISNSSALGTSDVLAIDNSGNMGIGTTSPSELLEVNSTGSSAAIEVSAGQASTTTGEAKIVLRSLHSSSGTVYSRSEIASLGVAGGDSDLIFKRSDV
jgi:hypothetical protein